MTPAAKFLVCKRAVELTERETMEVFGGNGYVDDRHHGPPVPRPVNSIWEGSGNVMCLDVMRAIGRDPASGHDPAGAFWARRVAR